MIELEPGMKILIIGEHPWANHTGFLEERQDTLTGIMWTVKLDIKKGLRVMVKMKNIQGLELNVHEIPRSLGACITKSSSKLHLFHFYGDREKTVCGKKIYRFYQDGHEGLDIALPHGIDCQSCVKYVLNLQRLRGMEEQ